MKTIQFNNEISVKNDFGKRPRKSLCMQWSLTEAKTNIVQAPLDSIFVYINEIGLKDNTL
jgi:hypothetical protein